MATAGLIEILDEMAAQILAVLEDEVDFEIQVIPRMVINPTPPTIDMYPGDVARGLDSAAFGDTLGEYLFTVRARVSMADQDAGQDFLLRLMDDTDELNLADALLVDPTLNGLAASMDVRDPSGYREYLLPGTDPRGALIGFQFTAHVIAARS